MEIKTKYRRNGLVAETVPVVDGKEHGIKKQYDRNGKLAAEIPLVQGIIHGVLRKFHANGNVRMEIPYTNGVVNGIKKKYNVNGVLLTEYPVEKGAIHGFAKHYHPNGSISETRYYEKGQYFGNFHFDYEKMEKRGVEEVSRLLQEEKERKLKEDPRYNFFFENLNRAKSNYKSPEKKNSVILDNHPKKVQQPRSNENINKQIQDALAVAIKQGLFNAVIEDGFPEEIANSLANYFQECYDKSGQKKTKDEGPGKKTPVENKTECLKSDKNPDLKVKLKQLPQENIEIHFGRELIVGDDIFTSETISSFEINYFDGEDTTSVWIEKGNGEKFLTRVWIKAKDWLGIYKTSTQIPFEHYMWVLFKKCNLFQWNCENFAPALSCKQDHGAIRLFTNQAKRVFGWIKNKPAQWDECMGYFYSFIRENVRTSYEKGCTLKLRESRIFASCSTIRDFCQIQPQPFTLREPSSIIYPEINLPIKSPIVEAKQQITIVKHTLDDIPKNEKDVCKNTDLAKGESFGDIVTSITIEKDYTTFTGNGCSVNRKIIHLLNKGERIEVTFMYYNINSHDGQQQLQDLDKKTFDEICDSLFFKSNIRNWKRVYSYDDSNLYENYYNHYGGEIRINFKRKYFGHRHINSLWTDNVKPPHWDEVVETIEKKCGEGILSL